MLHLSHPFMHTICWSITSIEHGFHEDDLIYEEQAEEVKKLTILDDGKDKVIDLFRINFNPPHHYQFLPDLPLMAMRMGKPKSLTTSVKRTKIIWCR